MQAACITHYFVNRHINGHEMFVLVYTKQFMMWPMVIILPSVKFALLSAFSTLKI
jgi:hypothetical protein